MTVKTPINKAELLQALEAVLPGLAPSPTVEQANAFCFRNGRCHTFDGETYCRIKTNLPADITAAAQGKPLVEALRGLEVEDIEVWKEKGKLYFAGRRDEVYVRCADEIQLPVEAVDKPASWSFVTPEFAEGLKAAAECAGKDDQQFLTTVVHLTPKWVECTDNFSFVRYRVKTGLEKPALIRAAAAKAIAERGPTRIAETPGWLHFKNPQGLYCAVRRFDPETEAGGKLQGPLGRFGEATKVRGKPIAFPKSVVSASKVAEIFASEYSDDIRVGIELAPGRMKLTGEGVSGGASHRSKVDYKGPEVSFTVGPKVLQALVEKHSEVEVAPNRLIVASGRLFFCTSTRAASNGHAEKPAEKKENPDA